MIPRIFREIPKPSRTPGIAPNLALRPRPAAAGVVYSPNCGPHTHPGIHACASPLALPPLPTPPPMPKPAQCRATTTFRRHNVTAEESMGWDLTPSASERHHGFTIADKWCRYTCAYRDYQGRTHCPPNRCICATKSPTPSPTPSPPTPSPTPSPTPTAVALHEEVELRLSESSSNIEASAVEPVRTGETPNGPRYMFLGTATELIKVLRDTPAGGAMNVVKRMALSGAGAKDCVALQVEAGADGFVYAAVSLVAKSLNVGHASVAAVLKIRKADLQVVGVHKFDQSSNMAYSLAMDADFLYSGQYTYPGRIVKMAKDSMSVASTLVLEKGQDDVRWIFKNQDSSSQRLFVLTNTAPGIVLRPGVW